MSTTQQKSLEKILKIISQSERYKVISINKNEDNTITISVRMEF